MKLKIRKIEGLFVLVQQLLEPQKLLFENGIFEPINKKTNKFIYPGIDINSVDALITNFHLPKSSLFILICAFMGTNKMIKAYEYAIKNNYRFYSYGDACLLEK